LLQFVCMSASICPRVRLLHYSVYIQPALCVLIQEEIQDNTSITGYTDIYLKLLNRKVCITTTSDQICVWFLEFLKGKKQRFERVGFCSTWRSFPGMRIEIRSVGLELPGQRT